MTTSEPPAWYARQEELKAAWRQAPEAAWRYEQVHEPQWLEISEASWHEALNVLPPHRWRQSNGPETFILAEMWADGPKGHLAWMFAKSHGRYYATLAHVADYDAMRAKVPCVPAPFSPIQEEPLERNYMGDDDGA
ncbi:MAG: hypothetical protein QOE90_3042 [Thermoplasmata archaeon]|jgi:hypothetical protein|nr:hypothetical protein [Thermoplasmata archaeon]